MSDINIEAVLIEIKTKVERIELDVKEFRDDLKRDYIRKTQYDELNKKIDEIKENMVSKAVFEPIQKIVWGMGGLILLTVLGAVLKLALRGGR